MTIQLLIGEVAKLLGVTTKTIRYYEGLGLLKEPQRTEAGYRLFDAQDLLQLHRIKHLQELGLSLERIRTLLEEPERARSAQDILCALEAEIAAQIAALEERRAQIRRLLAQTPVDLLQPSPDLPPTLKLLQESLGEQFVFDAAIATEAERLWAQLDAFLWNHAEYQQQQREMVQSIAAHPEARQQMASLITRISALANAPSEAEGLEAIAAEIVRLRTQNPVLAQMMGRTGHRMETVTPELLAQILTGATALSPAQRRLFDLVGEMMLDDRR